MKAVEVNSKIVTLVTEFVLEFDPKLCSLKLLSCFLRGVNLASVRVCEVVFECCV